MVVMETRALSNTKLKTFITAHAQAMFFLLTLVKQFSHFEFLEVTPTTLDMYEQT